MAIRVNTTLTQKSGLQVPAGAVISSGIEFPMTVPVITEVGGNEEVIPKRSIVYSTRVFVSLDGYMNQKQALITEEIPQFYEMEMSEEMHQSVLANGALAEFWLMNHLESILGEGTCELFDPFA